MPRIEVEKTIVNQGQTEKIRYLLKQMPDESGVYSTSFGELIVKMCGIDPENNVQKVVLKNENIATKRSRKNRRVFKLPREGSIIQNLNLCESLIISRANPLPKPDKKKSAVRNIMGRY